MDFCILFPSFESEKFDMYCSCCAKVATNCGPSFESEREREGERERETHLFRLHVTRSGKFLNASTVALRGPLATDSFIISLFISSFISGRGELSNIDAEWKCGFVECFQG